MYAYGTFYASNDYRFYLAHHGIKGQKWGVRRFQNADGSLTEAGQARAAKDKKGLLARTKIRVQGAIDQPMEYYRGVVNSKGVKQTISNVAGSGAASAAWRSNAYTEKRLAEASRTRLGKHIHNVRSYNANEWAKATQRLSDSNSVKSWVKNLVRDVPMKTIAGRDTTFYSQMAFNLLTGGVGNVALDAVYLWDKAHSKKG